MIKQIDEREGGYGLWMSWFAWYPVRTNRGWFWLTTVLRRERDNGAKGSQNHDWWWEYRPMYHRPSRTGEE